MDFNKTLNIIDESSNFWIYSVQTSNSGSEYKSVRFTFCQPQNKQKEDIYNKKQKFKKSKTFDIFFMLIIAIFCCATANMHVVDWYPLLWTANNYTFLMHLSHINLFLSIPVERDSNKCFNSYV